MVTTAYVPDRGDVVWLDFTPQAGHEQAGRRPALILSVAGYNAASGLTICCPVTNQVKGYPFEVPVVAALNHQLTGVVLADHVRSVDWRARKARKFAEVTPQCVHDVSTRIKLLLP
ncbi:mRNA-degrading endonuclease [Duganella caerulea]|uniref:endoribonuclease MazF n=1 Tax=Duganella caerulea TaxID=2885762 RepID=UPI0030E990B5